MRKHQRARVVVEFDPPPKGTNLTDAMQYIRDAVRSYGGSFHPDDPHFGHFRNASVLRYIVHNAKKEKPSHV